MIRKNKSIPSLYEMECAIARIFNPRVNIVVPNISWGLGVHECDVLIIRPSGNAIEIEIKRSKADLLQDKKKGHHHESRKIGQLYYAIPESLYDSCVNDFPQNAGIILITTTKSGHRYASIKKEAKKDLKKKVSPRDTLKAAHLGTLRIWSLKEKINALIKDKQELVSKLKNLTESDYEKKS